MVNGKDICEILEIIDCLCTCAMCCSDAKEYNDRRRSHSGDKKPVGVEPVAVVLPPQMYAPKTVPFPEPTGAYAPRTEPFPEPTGEYAPQPQTAPFIKPAGPPTKL